MVRRGPRPSMGHKPYLDPVLRDPKHMDSLARRLHDAGVMSVRRRARCLVGGVLCHKERWLPSVAGVGLPTG